jgi:hypothetical protein
MIEESRSEVAGEALTEFDKPGVEFRHPEHFAYVRLKLFGADSDSDAKWSSEDRRRVANQLAVAELERCTFEQTEAEKFRAMQQSVERRDRA